MSDLNFTVNADTSRARSNLEQLERRVGTVGDAFGRLKGAIGGLVAAAAVRNLFQMSNALADLSATTNVSIQSIAGLGEALARNGGNFEQANNAVLRFTETLGGAVDGNDKTREAFARIGVTLEDLQNLSEQDILRKTILGLGQVTDVGVRASLSAELLGKSLRGADLAGVARDLDKITEGQERFAGAAATAGEVNQSLQNSFRIVQQEILIALEPIADLARAITSNEKLIRNFIESIVTLAQVLGALFVARSVLKLFGELSNAASKTTGVFSSLMKVIGAGKAWDLAKAGARSLKIEKIELLNIFKKTGAGAEANAGIFKKLFSSLGGLAGGVARFLPLLGKLYIAFELVNFVVKQFTNESIFGWFDRAGKAIADLFSIEYKTSKEKEALAKEEAALARRLEDEKDQQAKRQIAESEKQRKAREDLYKEEQRITEAYRNQLQTLRDSITAYSRGNEAVQQRLRQEIQLIGLTEDQKMLKQSPFDVESDYQRELIRLQDLYNEKSSSGKREDMRLLPDIVKAMEELNVKYKQQIVEVQGLTEEKIKALNVEKQRLEIERQLQNFSDFANRSRLDGERKIRDLQREIAMSTMTDIERKYADIAIAAEESARSAIEAENARRKAINQPLLTSDEQQKYYEAANEGISELIQLTQRSYEQSREWGTGWNKAFKDYVDNATNAAKSAQRVFERATKGMEDALVNFAKTGKFEFKNFVNMVLEELLRIQIQKTFAQLMSGGSSTIGSSVGRLLGFANGGIIPTDRPVLVGERGPELLVGASGNRVIANDQLTGTSVTYNINAVDAMSFKEMLARDPSFLYAVTEQGRRRAPGTRR